MVRSQVPLILKSSNNKLLNQQASKSKILPSSNKVFIAYEHDGVTREKVARFIGKLGFIPILSSTRKSTKNK